MSYQNVKNHRKLTKERIVYVMGEKCGLCGLQDECLDIYDFHHINPEEKDFTISQGLYCNSWSKLITELKKGILLCANCHRKVHANINDFKFISNFIEERANEVMKQIEDLKTHKLIYCKNCGKIISSKAERCLKCNGLVQRIINRPSREELKMLIRTKPFTQIALEFSLSDNAIRKWCDNYKLPRTKKEINSYSDEEWELI